MGLVQQAQLPALSPRHQALPPLPRPAPRPSSIRLAARPVRPWLARRWRKCAVPSCAVAPGSQAVPSRHRQPLPCQQLVSPSARQSWQTAILPRQTGTQMTEPARLRHLLRRRWPVRESKGVQYRSCECAWVGGVRRLVLYACAWIMGWGVAALAIFRGDDLGCGDCHDGRGASAGMPQMAVGNSVMTASARLSSVLLHARASQ